MKETMNCERVQERLSQYLDGGLSALDEALDRGHMECCEACAKEREVLAGLMRNARGAMAPDAPELELEIAALDGRLEAVKLRPAALRLLGRRSTISLLTAAAAVLILMALEGAGESMSYLGSSGLFETLGMADWRLPLGDGLWEAKQ